MINSNLKDTQVKEHWDEPNLDKHPFLKDLIQFMCGE